MNSAMKLGFGMDEITQGVRLNDVAMETNAGDLGKLAESFDIDISASSMWPSSGA